MATQACINIEGNVELADNLQELILSILNTSAGDSVKEKALDVLQEAFPKPAPISISECYFTNEVVAEDDEEELN
jgi:endonuclease III